MFDTYGRFVGDVHVRLGRRLIDLGDWLLREGRALPALYESLSASEIDRVASASRDARRRGRGVWRALAKQVPKFDFGLRFRGPNAARAPDAGPVLIPKLFRRQTVWALNRRSKMITTSYAQYLRVARDEYFCTDDFLLRGNSAAKQNLGDSVGAGGWIGLQPFEIVLRESASRLVRGGKPVVRW